MISKIVSKKILCLIALLAANFSQAALKESTLDCYVGKINYKDGLIGWKGEASPRVKVALTTQSDKSYTRVSAKHEWKLSGLTFKVYVTSFTLKGQKENQNFQGAFAVMKGKKFLSQSEAHFAGTRYYDDALTEPVQGEPTGLMQHIHMINDKDGYGFTCGVGYIPFVKK